MHRRIRTLYAVMAALCLLAAAGAGTFSWLSAALGVVDRPRPGYPIISTV